MVYHGQVFGVRRRFTINLVRWSREYLFAFLVIFLLLVVAHAPFLHLSYFWDEAGYYIPAAYDFYKRWLLIPKTTLANGHVPLVMIYLGFAWHLFGFSETVSRVAMILIAAATILATYVMGKQVDGRESGAWAAVLLGLSPLFFAQSSLVLLDLTASLFTTLAIIFVLTRRWGLVAVSLSLATMSKETAVIVLPVIWAFLFLRVHERRARVWILSLTPLLFLFLWALYYRGETGYWIGNAKYLQYNLYSSLRPFHIIGSLLARIAEFAVLGFNWVLTGAAVAAILWERRKQHVYKQRLSSNISNVDSNFRDFLFLAIGSIGIYIVTLSFVGGAILPRYLLPVFPLFYVMLVALIRDLPKRKSRLCCSVVGVLFLTSWFINPPYPNFPYEDNLAYVSFIHLHQRAANYLETLPNAPVILSAWPATDELTEPFLGYVNHPLRVVSVHDFTSEAFANPPRFDVLYLYSRRWEPDDSSVLRSPLIRSIAFRLYKYEPSVQPQSLVDRFHLTLLMQFREHSQWVKIYTIASRHASRIAQRKMR